MRSETDPNRRSEAESQGGLPENVENERTENRRTPMRMFPLLDAHEGLGVYLVTWPSVGLLKVGVTRHRRYRTFLRRGGRLNGWWVTEHAYAVEDALHHVIDYPRAFSDKADAEPLLGGRGGGYCELYRCDDLQAATARVADCIAYVIGNEEDAA